MKNLENYGVLEMNAKEIRETEGGNPLAWYRVVAKLLATAAAFDEWYQQSGYIDDDMGIPFAA